MRFKIERPNFGILINTKLFKGFKFKIYPSIEYFPSGNIKAKFWYVNFKGGQLYIKSPAQTFSKFIRIRK